MRGHQLLQRIGTRHESRRLEFAETTEIGKLDAEAAGLGDGIEHLALQRTGEIPGRLPAHRRIQRQDQPAGIGRRRQRASAADKCVDRAGIRSRLCRRCRAADPDRGRLVVHGYEDVTGFGRLQGHASASDQRSAGKNIRHGDRPADRLRIFAPRLQPLAAELVGRQPATPPAIGGSPGVRQDATASAWCRAHARRNRQAR